MPVEKKQSNLQTPSRPQKTLRTQTDLTLLLLHGTYFEVIDRTKSSSPGNLHICRQQKVHTNV